MTSPNLAHIWPKSGLVTCQGSMSSYGYDIGQPTFHITTSNVLSTLLGKVITHKNKPVSPVIMIFVKYSVMCWSGIQNLLSGVSNDLNACLGGILSSFLCRLGWIAETYYTSAMITYIYVTFIVRNVIQPPLNS